MYPGITIGVNTKTGDAGRGQIACRNIKADEMEGIFYNQLEHRVVAELDGTYHIMTPTNARKRGAKVKASFDRREPVFIGRCGW